jgi:hypothetical protein
MVPTDEHAFWMDDNRMAQAPDAMKGAFDMNADAAREVRRKTFDMLVNEKMMAGGFHFPFPAFGRIEKMGNGFDFKPVA